MRRVSRRLFSVGPSSSCDNCVYSNSLDKLNNALTVSDSSDYNLQNVLGDRSLTDLSGNQIDDLSVPNRAINRVSRACSE